MHIKKIESILGISLNKHIFLSEVATVNHLQSISDVHCLPTLMLLAFISEWNPNTRFGLYNHAIKLENNSASTYLSTLDR